jgi:hypothetical protein
MRRKQFKTFTDLSAYLELIRPLGGDNTRVENKVSHVQAKRTEDRLKAPQEVTDQVGNGSELRHPIGGKS